MKISLSTTKYNQPTAPNFGLTRVIIKKGSELARNLAQNVGGDIGHDANPHFVDAVGSIANSIGNLNALEHQGGSICVSQNQHSAPIHWSYKDFIRPNCGEKPKIAIISH